MRSKGLSCAEKIAVHLNVPYGPIVRPSDVEESLRCGALSACTTEANGILEALFDECEISLIERAAGELGLSPEHVQLLQRSIHNALAARTKHPENDVPELRVQSAVVKP